MGDRMTPRKLQGLQAKVNTLRTKLTAQQAKVKTLTHQLGKPIADGFINPVEHWGRLGSEKSAADDFIYDRLTWRWNKLLRMYRGSWLVGLLIDSIAEDMWQYGVTLIGSLDPSDNKRLQNSFTRYGIWDQLASLTKKGRLFGGAIGWMDIDGQDPSTPLDMSTIAKGSFRGLRLYERWFVAPSMDDLVDSGPDMGLPRYYRILTPVAGMSPDMADNPSYFKLPDGEQWAKGSDLVVHHSRVIRSIGVDLPYIEQISESYWGMSVLERYQREINGYHKAYEAYAGLLSYLNVRVFKFSGLEETLSSGQLGQALQRRSEIINTYQSIYNATYLDKNDDFQMHQVNASALRDILLPVIQPMAGGESIPLVKFFGESPQGLNATGQSDENFYAGGIHRRQEKSRDPLTTLFKVMHCSELGFEPDKDFDFEFVSLIQESLKEKAEVAYGVTKTVVLALEAGIIDQLTAAKELSDLSLKSQGIFSNVNKEFLAAKEEEMLTPQLSNEQIAQEFKGDVLRGTSESIPHPAPGINPNLNMPGNNGFK